MALTVRKMAGKIALFSAGILTGIAFHSAFTPPPPPILLLRERPPKLERSLSPTPRFFKIQTPLADSASSDSAFSAGAPASTDSTRRPLPPDSSWDSWPFPKSDISARRLPPETSGFPDNRSFQPFHLEGKLPDPPQTILDTLNAARHYYDSLARMDRRRLENQQWLLEHGLSPILERPKWLKI